ncbi:MAG TPA: WXG100 family type VII secretion target [Anaerolineae bacterium]|nr:WXG100 family type VII secretion target [Anaerolineae bacterium]
MSDLLRVLPEELRAAANDLLQLSGEVSHVQSTVRHHWGRLDHGWQSYARAGVDAQYEETVREIERMALMLEQLGAALVKTAEIIAAADRDAAAFFAVEEVKPGGGKAPGLAKLMPDDAPLPPWEALPNKMRDLVESLPITTMRVTTYYGLNLRKTPKISDGNLAMNGRIPDDTSVYVHTNVPTQKDGVYEWRYITYIDAEGKAHSGWVVAKFLRPATPNMTLLPETDANPAASPVNIASLSKNEGVVANLHEQINEAAAKYGVAPALVATILYDELQRRGMEDPYQDHQAQSIIDAEGNLEADEVRNLERVIGLWPFDGSIRPEPIEKQSFGMAQMNVETIQTLIDQEYLDAPEGWADDPLDSVLKMSLDNTMAPILTAAYVKWLTDYYWQVHGLDLSNQPDILAEAYSRGLNITESSKRGKAIADNRERMEAILNYSPPSAPERVPTPTSPPPPSPKTLLTPTPTPIPTSPSSPEPAPPPPPTQSPPEQD